MIKLHVIRWIPVWHVKVFNFHWNNCWLNRWIIWLSIHSLVAIVVFDKSLMGILLWINLLFKFVVVYTIINFGWDLWLIFLNAWQSNYTALLIWWLFWLMDFIYYTFQLGAMLIIAIIPLLRIITIGNLILLS